MMVAINPTGADDFDAAEVTAELVTEYGRLVSRCGPASREAADFARRHRDNLDFVDVARSVRALEEGRRRRVRRRNTLIGLTIGLPIGIATVIFVVGLLIGYRRESDNLRALLMISNDYSFRELTWKTKPLYTRWPKDLAAHFERIEQVAQSWPPQDHPDIWPPPAMYIWARSALNSWRNGGFRRDGLDVLRMRIDTIKSRYPAYGRVHALEGLMHLALARLATDDGHGDIADAEYRLAIQAYHLVNELEGDFDFSAINNIGWSRVNIGAPRLGLGPDGTTVLVPPDSDWTGKVQALEMALDDFEQAIRNGTVVSGYADRKILGYPEGVEECFDNYRVICQVLLDVYGRLGEEGKATGLRGRSAAVLAAFERIYPPLLEHYEQEGRREEAESLRLKAETIREVLGRLRDISPKAIDDHATISQGNGE